jgi:hypothetical protein
LKPPRAAIEGEDDMTDKRKPAIYLNPESNVDAEDWRDLIPDLEIKDMPALDDMPPQATTIEQWRETCANLLRKGLIYDTGRTRDGEPLYALTPPHDKRH